jgi:hypothetical protein
MSKQAADVPPVLFRLKAARPEPLPRPGDMDRNTRIGVYSLNNRRFDVAWLCSSMLSATFC